MGDVWDLLTEECPRRASRMDHETGFLVHGIERWSGRLACVEKSAAPLYLNRFNATQVAALEAREDVQEKKTDG